MRTVLSPATEPIVLVIPRESIASPAAGPQPDRVLTNIRFPDEEMFKIVSLKIFVNRSAL